MPKIVLNADLTVDKIFNKTQILKDHPDIGRIVTEINNPKLENYHIPQSL